MGTVSEEQVKASFESLQQKLHEARIAPSGQKGKLMREYKQLQERHTALRESWLRNS